MQTRSLTAAVLCVLLMIGVGSDAVGQLPRIRLNSVFPPGGEVGTKFSVTISGELSDAASELVFSHPDIEAIQQTDAESEFRVAHRKPNQFDVMIGEQVPAGRYEVRALGSAGLSAPRSFLVSHLANKRFAANGNSKEKPFPIEVGTATNAQCRANERDYYQVAAQRFRPLLIQVLAERIDSKMDAAISIYDQSGKRVEKVRQSLTRDPILTFSPPADGDYVIEVADTTYLGGADYFYRLEVSESPHVEAVFPNVAQPDVETDFTVYGYNLPGGVPVSGARQAGNLQSANVKLTTESAKSNLAGWQNSIAQARLDGHYVRLPHEFLSAPPIFVATATGPVTREAESTDSNPQIIKLPSEIAGQFYPRRDRDWFQFNAKKGKALWLELSAQQFGQPVDPTLRIQRRTKDGKLQNVANADDIEGPPNSRDSRRFYSGTQDVALRFNPPADGQYVVTVSDQYNVSFDDPRLSYRLTIQPAKPGFCLFAFADPERHNDEKIAKPNGLGILPGGSVPVRIRMLPLHGFNKAIRVKPESLPDGVTASPLVLSNDSREGLLVLQAAQDAKPQLHMLRLKGESLDGKHARTATNSSIIVGANNTDAQATKSRQVHDLPLAILECKQSPIWLSAKSALIRLSRGSNALPVELMVGRRDDFKDYEISAALLQGPTGLKIDGAKSKTGKLAPKLNATDAKLKPGTYSLIIGAKVKDKRPRNPFKVEEAKGDTVKSSKRLAELSALLKNAQANVQEQSGLMAAAKQQLVAVQSRSQEPKNKLTQNLQQQLAASKALTQQLQAAVGEVQKNGPAALGLQEVSKSEQSLAKLKQERDDLQKQFATLAAELAKAQSEVTKIEATSKAATEQSANLQKQRDEAQKQKTDSENRYKELEKNELNKEAEFWVYSNAITVDIANSPITTSVTKQHRVQQNEVAEIGLLIDRGYGFKGQVSVELVLPGESKLVATPLVMGKGVDSGRLVVSAAKDSAARAWAAKLKTKLSFNGLGIVEETPVRIQVTKAEAK